MCGGSLGGMGLHQGRMLFQAENERSQRHRAVRTACPYCPSVKCPTRGSAPKALPTLALASYHLPGPAGTCPVTPSFLLGTLSLSFNDIKTKRLTLVLDFNGANVLPFYSDFLVKLEMRVFFL